MHQEVTHSSGVERPIAPLGTLPAVFLLALGLPTLLFGIVQAVEVYRNLSPLEAADGVVVAIEVRHMPDPEGSRTSVRSYSVVVDFSTVDGMLQRLEEPTGTLPSQYSEGDTVWVLYDPEDPSRARVDLWRATWQGPVTYIALGLLPLLTLLVWGAWTVSISRGRKA